MKDCGILQVLKVLETLQKQLTYGVNCTEFKTIVKNVFLKHNFQIASFKATSPFYIQQQINLEPAKTILLIDQLESTFASFNNIETVANVFQSSKKTAQSFIIFEPFGKAKEPDFLVLTKDWILAFALKCLTPTKPTNQQVINLPKANLIYLLTNFQQMTFFLGSSYQMLKPSANWSSKAFNQTDLLPAKISFNPANPFGINPQIRIDQLDKNAFDKEFSFLKGYENIFSFAKVNHWAENVLNYLKALADCCH